jgi:hypothetical protein
MRYLLIREQQLITSNPDFAARKIGTRILSRSEAGLNSDSDGDGNSRRRLEQNSFHQSLWGRLIGSDPRKQFTWKARFWISGEEELFLLTRLSGGKHRCHGFSTTRGKLAIGFELVYIGVIAN